jgi:hypothetical protein
MKNLRYTQLIKPMETYFEHLTPPVKYFVHFLEGGLVIVLLTSQLLYI